MAKLINVYECEYCSKQYKTEKGVLSHEAECSEKPEVKFKESLKDTDNKKIEEIRQSAVNIDDLINKITEFLLTKGVKIDFTSYPFIWRDSIRNSHNSPKGYKQNWGDDPNIPKGYPGWQGRWEGTITKLDNCTFVQPEISFGDLKSTFSDFLNIWYINTGTGTSGSNFSIDGILWLYDFPKMHKEWEKDGGRLEQLSNEYNKLLKEYESKFISSTNNYVNNDTEIKNINEKLDELNRLANKLTKVKTHLIKNKTQEFINNYKIELPELTHNIINFDEYNRIKNKLKAKPIDEIIPESLEYIESLEILETKLDEYKTYSDKYAELYI